MKVDCPYLYHLKTSFSASEFPIYSCLESDYQITTSHRLRLHCAQPDVRLSGARSRPHNDLCPCPSELRFADMCFWTAPTGHPTEHSRSPHRGPAPTPTAVSLPAQPLSLTQGKDDSMLKMRLVFWVLGDASWLLLLCTSSSWRCASDPYGVPGTEPRSVT